MLDASILSVRCWRILGMDIFNVLFVHFEGREILVLFSNQNKGSKKKECREKY